MEKNIEKKHRLMPYKLKTMSAIEKCRTVELGAHIDKDDLQDELDASVGENKTTVTGSGTLKVKFEDTKNEYTVSQNGTVAKYEEVKTTDIYATVCTNGTNSTLIFSNNESDINTYLTNNSTSVEDGYTIKNIKDDVYYWNSDDDYKGPAWIWNDTITKVIFLNTIVPKNTAKWFFGLQNLTDIENMRNLNTINVTDMSFMFSSCSSLTSLDLSNFDTSNVTNMNNMFVFCEKIETLDVSSFNTSNVNFIMSTFSGCSGLKTIYASNNFVTRGLDKRKDDRMFNECTSLKGGNGTVFNSSKIRSDMAQIDTASTPGYFTLKTN